MSIENKNIFENVGITSADIARAVINLVCEFPRLHLLSPVSEHFQHPLDDELEPVTDWPGQPYHYPQESLFDAPE